MTIEAAVLPDLNASGAALLRRFVAARAAALARAGHYEDAAELLPADASRSASELDLLARIRIQQGRLAEAEALWTRARQLAPDDERIARALRRLHARSHGRVMIRAIFTVAVVVVAFALGMTLRTSPAASPPLQKPEPPRSEPGISLTVPGLRTHRNGSVLTAEFERPPFTDGADLTPEAKASLALAADQLRRIADVHVVACGQADRVPVSRGSRYRDNEDLALARASAAVRHLVASGLPASLCSIRGAVDSSASAAHVPDKRTAVLYVMKRKPDHGN